MIKIRNFHINDYNDVIRLWDQTKLPFKPKGRDSLIQIRNEIKKENSIFFVAVDNRKIIGSIFGTHDGRKGWINRLAVHPDYQRKGIAKNLCFEVENKLNNLGIEIICCLIENYNINSFNFFNNLGYILHEDIKYLSKRKNNEI
jgi:ribosomal protein S18 acetylase RimI-like enzyme